VYAGTYTFSTRPYPTPSGVSAVLADPSNPRLYPYLNDSTAERMTRVFGERNLRPAMAAGDLTLWLPGGADTLVLPRPARAPAPIGRRVTYDQTIALLGRAAVPPHAARGDLIPLPLQWMRVAPTDRRWVALFALANGKQFRRFIHPFGGAAIGPERWPEDVPIDETYRMLIPMDAEPGLYEIGVVVGSLSAGTAKPAVADDPEAASQGGFVTLGTVEISAR
jgi:hypothetical protein